MLVSGELDPDATGLYERTTVHNGKPTWTIQSGGWSIWDSSGTGHWTITPEIGIELGVGDPGWLVSPSRPSQIGEYASHDPATGTATVTEALP